MRSRPPGRRTRHHLVERLLALVGVPDVVKGEIAHHQIERPAPKRQLARVTVVDVDPVVHALQHRVALGGGQAVAALIDTSPDIHAHRSPPRDPLRREHEDRTSSTADVEHVLVAAKAQLVENLRPDRSLARPR